MRLTFLGTGTSQGVPVIGCECDVCKSTDSRDKRLRTSAMVECDGVRIVIDAGPDFRGQMLREGVRHLDAILLTHQHKDHTAGIDDVRAFNFVDYPEAIHSMHIFGNEATIATITKDFDYAFAQNKYRGVPVIELHTITADSRFEVKGIEITPIEGRHSERFKVFGYRIGKLAYLTDFDAISDTELSKLEGVECLVINALRWTTHSSHFSVGQALDIIKRVRPKRALLTHMSHEIGRHAEADALLSDGVQFAYDGLKVEIE